MTDKEKQILDTFGKIIPKLSESNKKYLLGLGEGMVIAQNTKKEKELVQQ